MILIYYRRKVIISFIKKSIGPKIEKKQIEKFDQSCKNAEVNKGHISTNYLSVYILNLYQHCNPYTQRQIHL